MEMTLAEKLRALDEATAPGRAVQYHSLYCPEAEDDPNFVGFDTSHDMSLMNGGERYRIGTFKHASFAHFVQELVNAYRAGELVTLDQVQDIVTKEAMIDAAFEVPEPVSTDTANAVKRLHFSRMFQAALKSAVALKRASK